MDVAIATMTAAPRATYRPNGSIPDSDVPVPGTATSVAPGMVRCGSPTPTVSAVPPITMAAMLSSRRPEPNPWGP